MRSVLSIFRQSVATLVWVFAGLITAWAQPVYEMPAGATATDYEAATVVLKVWPEYRAYCSETEIAIPELKPLFDELEVTGVTKMFRGIGPPLVKKNLRTGAPLADISLIYKVRFEGKRKISTVINRLLESGVFAYAEPNFYSFVDATVNDPLAEFQYHLDLIGAYDAWDITTGDEDVLIAIIDTGIDFEHPDLVDQIAKNDADPINGLDDNADGYEDNFQGWNFVDDNSDPQYTENDHGVHVSGCAAPSTNNGEGVAGVGYNCKILPVRVGATRIITHGYEGIAYAAEQGASIINCSWGGNFRGQFGQDIIDFAVINHDALVIAAAGNTSSELRRYPAAYDHVLSVASTQSDDGHSGFTTRGYTIDLSSPGSGIYSAQGGGGYRYDSGTSMAAPVAAGCAALLRSHRPDLTAHQVREILKATTDDIYGVESNVPLQGLLGTGRINVLKALNFQGGIPAVVFTNRVLDDADNGLFKSGELITMGGLFTNHLDGVGNLTATLRTESEYLQLVDTVFNIGALATAGSTDNYAIPFSFEVLPTEEINQEVTVEVVISNGTYTTSEFVQFLINVDYINIFENEITTTISSNGQIGYTSLDQSQGVGFRYQGSASYLFEGGLMIGTETGNRIKVLDRVRGADPELEDLDFEWTQLIDEVDPPTIGDIEVRGTFTDAGGRSDEFGLEVEQLAYAWDLPGHEKYVVVEYKVTNTSFQTPDALHVGMLLDWDIDDANNYYETDFQRHLGYVYQDSGDFPVVGAQLLTGGGFNSYGMDLVEGGNGGANPNDDDGYRSAEKMLTMRTSRPRAGQAIDGGNDVVQVISSGSFSLAPQESVTVAFAILAADDLLQLQNAADSAYFRYNGRLPNLSFSDEVQLLQNFPNPFSTETTVNFELLEETDVRLSVVDLSGREVMLLVDGARTRGTHQIDVQAARLAPGTYFLNLQTTENSLTRPMIVVK